VHARRRRRMQVSADSERIFVIESFLKTNEINGVRDENKD